MPLSLDAHLHIGWPGVRPRPMLLVHGLVMFRQPTLLSPGHLDYEHNDTGFV